MARRAGRFFDDFYGAPAEHGIPEKPGVMARLQSIEKTLGKQDEQLSHIVAELSLNSGHSVKDTVKKILDQIEKK